ncbi:hypothetical protein SLEP1_g20305 [Rubroshorea leprosula]|uniref:Uncharacterized protein n=1 Tax=Rubroshorea leprosula TaxID=152421 RepID=A0AAV5J288_9ROSI|nr:hypothetical protein SLEP1_g20305 [Rubroshorea leprosula]
MASTLPSYLDQLADLHYQASLTVSFQIPCFNLIGLALFLWNSKDNHVEINHQDGGPVMILFGFSALCRLIDHQESCAFFHRTDVGGCTCTACVTFNNAYALKTAMLLSIAQGATIVDHNGSVEESS